MRLKLLRYQDFHEYITEQNNLIIIGKGERGIIEEENCLSRVHRAGDKKILEIDRKQASKTKI